MYSLLIAAYQTRRRICLFRIFFHLTFFSKTGGGFSLGVQVWTQRLVVPASAVACSRLSSGWGPATEVISEGKNEERLSLFILSSPAYCQVPTS